MLPGLQIVASKTATSDGRVRRHGRRGLVAQDLWSARVVRTDDDHAAQVLAGGLAPVPHIERMNGMVRVAEPIRVDKILPRGELGFVLVKQHLSVARLGQHAPKELGVGRVLPLVEAGAERMGDDERGEPVPAGPSGSLLKFLSRTGMQRLGLGSTDPVPGAPPLPAAPAAKS
mgnify:CR=1 FL=1